MTESQVIAIQPKNFVRVSMITGISLEELNVRYAEDEEKKQIRILCIRQEDVLVKSTNAEGFDISEWDFKT